MNLRLIDIFEAMIKRSDPYISGAVLKPPSMPIATKTPVAKKPSTFDTKILNMANKAGVSPQKVEALWFKHKSEIDTSKPGAYGIITARVKRDLNIP